MGSGGEEAMMFAVVWDYERFQQWGEANDRFGVISPVRRQRPSSMVDRRRLLEFCVEGEKMVVLVAIVVMADGYNLQLPTIITTRRSMS